jgi:hypothetical protein
MAGDTILIEQSSEILHILVTEQGGRVTAGFDSTAVPASRMPLYGSFGPFVAARPARTHAMATSVGPRREIGLANNVQRGIFQFYNEDVLAYRPVSNAQLNVTCLDANFNPTASSVAATASDGSFSISCPSGYYDASILLRNRFADVMNTDRGSAGVVYFNESVGAYPTLNANNNAAAYIHVVLNQYVPVAEQRFGYSRARVPVTVNMTDTTVAHYDQINDTIRTNHARATGSYGRYVTLHEYGHAYHWRAIEGPATYFCNEANQHSLGMQTNFNCALVEGFAEFFGAWLLESVLTDHPYGDYALEVQTHYSGKDCAQVEGAVAGFLYDLVDGTSSPNGRANETGDEDWWGDGATYPASFIANVMRSCTLTSGTNTYTNLWGSDDLVYCLENSTTAASAAAALGYPSWYRYDSVARNVAAPTGVTFDMTRRLWKRNFYGVSQ